jgi:hypothetical protein
MKNIKENKRKLKERKKEKKIKIKKAEQFKYGNRVQKNKI